MTDHRDNTQTRGQTNDTNRTDLATTNNEGDESAKVSKLLQYLPAIFHRAKEEQRAEQLWVNEFLLAFEQEYERVDALLAVIDQYFSPSLLNTESDPDFLPWLASWVALTLDEEWDEEKRRRLIGEAVRLYRWRGTAHGLKRYLEIYTGLDPKSITLFEGYRPGGMQIGVASRIGHELTLTAPNDRNRAPWVEGEIGDAWTQRAFYIVETMTPTDVLPGTKIPDLPSGSPLQLYYAVEPTAGYHVERIALEEQGVRLWIRLPGKKDTADPSAGNNGAEGPTVQEFFHIRPPGMKEANIRRSNIEDYGHLLEQEQDGESAEEHAYHGGSFLIDRVIAPYHFIVDLNEPLTEATSDPQRLWQRLAKIQAILDRERPAHTIYHMNLAPTTESTVHQWMQIDVRSTIGLDSTVG